MTEWSYDALEVLYDFVGRFGLPLAILAWFVIAGVAAWMVRVLRRLDLTPHWKSSMLVGAVALAAHLADTFVTLYMSPDLAAEANPLWRPIVDTFGLPLAIAYGISGKVLLSVVCFEAYLYYAADRRRRYPQAPQTFRTFWRNFGNQDKLRVLNFFAYAFAVVAPFTFYIVVLNLLINSPLYMKLPAMPIVLVLYLVGLTASYFVVTYRDFRSEAAR